jgi:tetratricopeptide (TPR) repeat protein
MSGLDRLTAELLRLSAGGAPAPSRTVFSPGAARLERPERSGRFDFRPVSQPAQQEEMDAEEKAEVEAAAQQSSQRVRKKKARRRSAILVPALALLVLLPIGVVAWAIRSGGGFTAQHSADSAGADKPLTGIAGQMRMAADFAAEKDYAKAESTYRLILKSDPNNRDAIKELASVLFRQQRYDEAAAVLKSIPPE